MSNTTRVALGTMGRCRNIHHTRPEHGKTPFCMDFEPNVWNLSYEGPTGEPNYYRVRAVEVAEGLFNVYVRRADGTGPSGAWGTVVDAENWIIADRHVQAVAR